MGAYKLGSLVKAISALQKNSAAKAAPEKAAKRITGSSVEPTAAPKLRAPPNPRAPAKAKAAAPKKSGKGAIAVKEKAGPARPRGRPTGAVKKKVERKKKASPKKAA